MANINFVPDDYIQKKESNRANWMYLFLCLVLLGALGGTFGIIKVQQSRLNKQVRDVAARMLQAQEDIKQVEELQVKRKRMMQTALTAVELLETAPRSVIVASLTNNLPEGTSMSKAQLSEKVFRDLLSIRGGTSAKAGGAKPDTRSDIYLEIEGLAPSDKQVAEYIANLDSCEIFSGVDLIYTKEFKNKRNDASNFRMFKITTKLDKNTVVTKKFIESIRYYGV